MAKRSKAGLNTELAKKIVSKFTHALTWRNPYKEKWDRYYKMYRSFLEETNYPWQSNLWIPYSFSTIETLAPRMISNKPQIDIMPREPGDVEYAKVMEQLVDFQWEKMDMQVKLPDIVKEMLIYGTSILKVYWKDERKNVEEAEPVDPSFPELGTVELEKEKVLYSAPCVELVDLYDFFIDPKATTIDNAQWAIHRTVVPFKKLQALEKQKIYKNVKLVQTQSKFTLHDDEDKAERFSTIGVNVPTEIFEEDEPEKKLVELMEYWEDDRVITIANRSVIIRDEVNPYKHGKKPFVRVVDQSVPHEFYGMGELEPIESLQYELNNRRNQRMDNVTLVLNRMWKSKNGANVDENELVSTPGGVVHTDDMDGVEPFPMQDVTASSYQEETLIKSDIQQTTGVSDFTRGVGNESLANETATGISLIQEAGNARFRLKIQNLEEMCIKRLGQLMVSMNEQFIEDEQVLRITGEQGLEFISIEPEMMKSDFDVIVQSGSTMPNNKAVERKQALDLYQLFAGDPMVNQTELKRTILESFEVKNIDKLLEAGGAGMIPPAVDTGGQLNQTGVLAAANPNQQPKI